MVNTPYLLSRAPKQTGASLIFFHSTKTIEEKNTVPLANVWLEQSHFIKNSYQLHD